MNEDTRAFNEALVERFYNNESVSSIARTSGRSTSYILKLIQEDKTANGPRERRSIQRVDPRLLIGKEAISPLHSKIGMMIARYRATKSLSKTQMGNLIPVSRVVVSNAEIGAHDLTITQLQRLAEILGVSIKEFVE